ncbi:DNA-binding MarR family transcriptional regulator [Murinocardiopsis flavida]|uniref:DNA-binding MarR family transcriptional regulator n=1 Tax=Murinocardiopsis flavida TaxID=645275 RepID=A0A2P8DU63_9ACTN|nr:MarR family winged helix-turn-helix transcriptional regulator [Murinocardiopsis flavida]PSL00760.1 DNA-binding MarR family transcriptional regulator [Murinocardiopsis flavida]
MSTEQSGGERAAGSDAAEGMSVDEGIRTLLLLMPRLVGRAKRTPPPERLKSANLAPRHLSLLAYLLFDGPLGVNELARRLEVAPATVSLMVGDLNRRGVLDRTEDDADRRRTVVSIAEANRDAVDAWLARSAAAWRSALDPLTPEERATFVRTMAAYERALAADPEL